MASFFLRVCLVAFLAVNMVSAAKLRKTGIVTKGDLEGTACSPDEYERFSIIVCGESLQKCTYEWCDKYITAWRKKFGASVGRCVISGRPGRAFG